MLSSQPARRLNPAKLAESSVLKNKLVDTIAFLENLAVKDSAEKDLFFKRLPGAIPGLPLPVLRRKLLPMLAQALTFGGAPAVALGSILQVKLSSHSQNTVGLLYTPFEAHFFDSCNPLWGEVVAIFTVHNVQLHGLWVQPRQNPGRSSQRNFACRKLYMHTSKQLLSKKGALWQKQGVEVCKQYRMLAV